MLSDDILEKELKEFILKNPCIVGDDEVFTSMQKVKIAYYLMVAAKQNKSTNLGDLIVSALQQYTKQSNNK